jgi:hypothetical protein
MFLISSQSRDFCDKCVRAWLRALPRRGFEMFRRHRNPFGQSLAVKSHNPPLEPIIEYGVKDLLS